MEKSMLVLITVLCSMFTASWSESAETEVSPNGYIFTSLRSMRHGGTNDLHLRRYGQLSAGFLKVKVYYTESYKGNESLAVEQEYEIKEGEKDSKLQLYLPPFDFYVYNGKITIDGSFNEGSYIIRGTEKVSFHSSNDHFVVIQTDKPLYKDGQTVKMRILQLDKEFRPVNESEANIWVEDPNGARLFQWNKVPLGSGIKQLEFPLADEPVHGSWKVSASVKESTTTANFEVKEYVLPKFDVEINLPPYVLANAEEIPISVCAKYTYGKLVKGKLSMNISLEKYAWSTNEKIPQLEIMEDIDGCFSYVLNVSLVEIEGYYRYRRLEIKVDVEEDGTGVHRNESRQIQRQFSPLNMDLFQDKHYFKPGLPFNGQLKVTNPDDTPAPDEPVQICATVSRERILSSWWAQRKVMFCKNYTSDVQGVIRYTLPPQNVDAVNIKIEAKSMKYVQNQDGVHRESSLSQPQTSISVSPFYSPSGSFVQLQPEEDELKCGSKKQFKILFTSKEDQKFTFYYEVVRAGKVMKHGTVEKSFSVQDDISKEFQDQDRLIDDTETLVLPNIQSNEVAEEECPSAKEARYVPPVGSVTLDLDIDSTLSPSFHLLVFYIRDDRETVADAQKFKVEQCFKNQVEFQFGDEVKQPGMKTSLRLKASPNSMCGTKVIDKSVSLMDSSDQLTKDKIFNVREGMDPRYFYSINHCNEPIRQAGLYSSMEKSILPLPRPWSSSSHEDSITAFENTGVLVISDLTLVTRPCKSRENTVYSQSAYAESGYAGGAGMGGAVAMASTARKPAVPASMDSKIGEVAPLKSAVEVRTIFPETWLFDMHMIGGDGELEMKEKLPHTITEWVGSAVCINSEDGLGLSEPTSIKGFQAFFLSFTLPYSVIRGEKFRVTVSLYNYVQQALPIRVTMDDPEGYIVVGNSINGDICVQPGTSTNLQLVLMGKTIGKVNMTVRAETTGSSNVCGDAAVSDAVARDAITQSFIVEAEGWPVENVDNVLVCSKDEENGVFSKKRELSLPEDVVEDSARAYIDVTANVMGKAIDNLDRLVTVPTGCGEQNMVKFTPNIVVLDYLTYTGELTDKIKDRAIRNLNTGAQRQMNYVHPGGSMSAFGTRDREGSMFLTAFVLRSFSEATKYITIDNSTISKMQLWIASKQQKNGCFPDSGKLYSSSLQGGVGTDKSQVAITAYVLASLLRSGYQNETVINSAMSCILKKFEPSSPYVTYLVAYVQALVGSDDSGFAIALKEMTYETGGVQHIKTMNGSQSLKLETAAYAVLSILKSTGKVEEVLPFVRYMTQNMNPLGGFVSTQDTCVGLEALGEFGKIIFKDPLDMKVLISGALDATIDLVEEEKMLVKRNKIPQVPSTVNIETAGSGCALIQTVLRYNSNKPPQQQKFELSVAGECADSDCKRGKIAVSVSYSPEGKKSGMALVEVKMISGYAVLLDSLQQLLAKSESSIMRYDIENNVVVFYFNELTNEEKFFVFDVEQVADVEDRKPGTAKVYDYYSKEDSSSSSYTIEAVDVATIQP